MILYFSGSLSSEARLHSSRNVYHDLKGDTCFDSLIIEGKL